MAEIMSNNQLETEIEAAAKRERSYGWSNYFAAYVVAILALVGSVAATLLAALGARPLFTAVVAAIPVVVLAFTRIFNFERRAFYHWRKSKTFQGLLRKLRYENVDAKVVSAEFSRAYLQSLDEWIPFGVGDKEE
jgi:hypothetical protein